MVEASEWCNPGVILLIYLNQASIYHALIKYGFCCNQFSCPLPGSFLFLLLLCWSSLLLNFPFQVMKAVADQYRLPAPHSCPPALHALMLQCWQADRQDRLGFDSLLSSLDRLIRHPASLKAEHSRWEHSHPPSLTYNNKQIWGLRL